jgi:moderate conductance mechanosensitive channel
MPEALAPELRWGLNWEVVISGGLRLLVALLLASFAFWALRLLTLRLERSIEKGEPSPATLGEQRARTLVGLVRSVGIVFILLIPLFTRLGINGVDIRPLLAGAGVVAWRSRSARNRWCATYFSGLFILFANQFGVGDIVRIGDAGGLVEKMTLRIVVLRDAHGVVT